MSDLDLPLRFQCTQCGVCCTGSSDDDVEVTHDEAASIREFLGVSKAWFRRRYLRLTQNHNLSLVLLDNGRCIFLDSDNRCRIYSVRPKQCASYPFWPEVVSSKTAWLREAKRCEGIGQGPVVVKIKMDKSIIQPVENESGD